MKNITITLDESLARWAKIEAAKSDKSLSRWIGDRLAALRALETAQPAPDWLDAPLWPSAAEPLPSRSELYETRYDRSGFRGHEHPDLQPRRERASEGSTVGGMAEEPRPYRTGREPTGPE